MCYSIKGGFDDWLNNGGKYVDGTTDHKKLIDYEDVKNGIGSDSFLMIDVRNPHELLKTGRIPGTKNVPCK